jgi:Protein of unknown function (DUF429)
VTIEMLSIIGVDFTSAPSRRKPIVVARCALAGLLLTVKRLDSLTDFTQFEALLAEPGPWIGGFDLPFGLPRELVARLDWPDQWTAMVTHARSVGKDTFKSLLNDVRQARPVGSRYIARRGDIMAGSSSPMKLVNPPVGLMFFEGAPRIARAGMSVIPCAPGGDSRVALEAYPGYLARQFTRNSYKKDGPDGRLPLRRMNRELILCMIEQPNDAMEGLRVDLPAEVTSRCCDDGSGDALDAVLCAVQAAMAANRHSNGDKGYGTPAIADPLEGWIATVPAA